MKQAGFSPPLIVSYCRGMIDFSGLIVLVRSFDPSMSFVNL